MLLLLCSKHDSINLQKEAKKEDVSSSFFAKELKNI